MNGGCLVLWWWGGGVRVAMRSCKGKRKGTPIESFTRDVSCFALYMRYHRWLMVCEPHCEVVSTGSDMDGTWARPQALAQHSPFPFLPLGFVTTHTRTHAHTRCPHLPHTQPTSICSGVVRGLGPWKRVARGGHWRSQGKGRGNANYRMMASSLSSSRRRLTPLPPHAHKHTTGLPPP